MIFGIVFPEGRARALGIPMIEIGVGVFIGAVEGEDELSVKLPPGSEIEAQGHCAGDIIDVHCALPEPARPVAVFGVHRAVPIRNKPPRA